MCGISLILSGIRIVSSSSDLLNGFQHAGLGSLLQEETRASGTFYPTVDDLKEVVSRRGPDHVGLRTLKLEVDTQHGPNVRKGIQLMESKENICFLEGTSYVNLEVTEKLNVSAQMTSFTETQAACFQMNKEEPFEEHMNKYPTCGYDPCQGKKSCIIANFVDGIHGQTTDGFPENKLAQILFLGATLQLRGLHSVFQPLVDSCNNVLVYNGEIFGGIPVGEEENDTEVLMNALQRCCSCPCHASRRDCHCFNHKDHISIPQLLSTIKGPWALIYWQANSKILWFGRDAFGRRSLLVHWPSLDDTRFLLSSVAPYETAKNRIHRSGSCEDRGASCQIGADNIQGIGVYVDYWDELTCGIYSLSMEIAGFYGKNSFIPIVGTIEKHDWYNSLLKKLLNWKRPFVESGSNDILISKLTCQIGKETVYSKHSGLSSSIIEQRDVNTGCPDCIAFNSVLLKTNAEMQVSLCNVDYNRQKVQLDIIRGEIHSGLIFQESTVSQGIEAEFFQDPSTCSVHRVLYALKQAVIRRTCESQFNQIKECGESTGKHAPIAVLFSGGLDSMILAALLNQCLDPNCEIDLLNISFDGPYAPDRISAKAGIIELQRIAPFRRWHLVEIDADPSNLQSETKYLTSIIHPARTYMDLNIGMALWLAAHGDGWVEEDSLEGEDEYYCNNPCLLSTEYKKLKRKKYKSEARILLVGSGADEQCAGYGRHRTKFRQGGWVALQEELKIDVQRIWKRNLGRDDRCIADHGKEARFPFLDEDVIDTLLELPLWEIADLEKPSGQGDKKILREVAQVLGLEGASTMPKRAIQFGSRIARESNRRNFGSNRAANQASAGSAVIHCFRE